MWNQIRPRAALLALAVAGLSAACESEEGSSLTGIQEPGYAAFDSTFASNPNRTFAQIERLGNPLTSEVFIEKREHPTFNIIGPDKDWGHFRDDIVAFVTDVAGRSQAYGNTVASVLVGTQANPGDMLTVFTTRAAGVTSANVTEAATVGWLSHILAPNNTGYGGRKLMGDDTVDKGLGVIFGNAAGNNDNVSPGLTTDNVDSNDKAAMTTFPYLATPHQ